MASFNKFNSFVEALAFKVHNLKTTALGGDTLKILLVGAGTPPIGSNSVKGNLTEIAAGNGYSAGGPAVNISGSSQTAGTYKLTIDDVTITASGGSIGPFQYFVLYNDTATNDELIGYWNYGSAITLANGESVTADFSATNGAIQLL